MRRKKDPGIRQEAFIYAATELFMEKGFEAVSIRDVLDAVADKTASPSVFYYYFSSKDALYRACVHTVAKGYLSAMGEGFSMEKKTKKDWMLSLAACMEAYLLQERNLIMTGDSTPNRLFILDLREQVTGEISRLWAESLPLLTGAFAGDEADLALFLAGGISEMLFTFLLGGRRGQASVHRLSETIVRFCANTMELPENEKAQLLQALKQLHEKNKQKDEV